MRGVVLLWWRWRESNPRPRSVFMFFSVRSPAGSFLDPCVRVGRRIRLVYPRWRFGWRWRGGSIPLDLGGD